MAHTIKEIEYAGWKRCIYLSNGVFETVLSTEVGPRILRYSKVGGPNLLYLDSYAAGQTSDLKVWRIYGGHTFDALTEGKPLRLPENQPIGYSKQEDGVSFEPVVFEKQGFSKTVAVRMCRRGGLEIKETLQNLSDTPLTISAMGSTHLNISGRVALPAASLRQIASAVKGEKVDQRRLSFGGELCFVDHDMARGGEYALNFDLPELWCAYFLYGVMFVMTSPAVEGAVYDENAMLRVEADANKVAISSFSPRYSLEKGEAFTHVEVWNIFPEVYQPTTEQEALEALHQNKYFYSFEKKPVKGLDL